MSKVTKKDYLLFFATMFGCFISVYLLPDIINKLFFLAILALVYATKKNYFWYALFFILICTPGSLFYGSSAATIHRLPIYTFFPGISFSIFDIFLLITLIKAIVKRKPNPLFLNSYFKFLAVVYVSYFLYSLILGMSFNNIITFARNSFYFTLLFSIPRLLPKPQDMFRFAHLVFPLVILVLVGAFWQMLFLSRLIDPWVGPETNLNSALARGSKELYSRPILYGTMLAYFSLVFSLFYLSRKDYSGNKAYLIIIGIISIITLIISQTRGWISLTILVVTLFIVFIQKIRSRNIFYIFFGLLSIYILYIIISPLKIAIDNSLVRYSTVESLVQGDITAEGTTKRFSERLPAVMKGVSINPAIGLGFSDKYWIYADYHVGFATMLLQIGFFGYIVFAIFWTKFYWIIYKNNYQFSRIHPMRGALLMYPITLTGCLLLHFTSYQFMGFEFSAPPDYFFICLLFSFADNSLKEAKNIDCYLKSLINNDSFLVRQ